MRRNILAIWTILPLLTLLLGSPAFASPHEVRIPLREGKLHLSDLTGAVCREMHLREFRFGHGDIDLNSWKGSLFLEAVNTALGDGCSVRLSEDGLVLHFDPEKLPRTIDADKRALRRFVEVETPEATAAQARHWGLFLPARVDPNRPLVVLTHGLECGYGMLQPMGDLLKEQGFQVGYFCYPNDQALEESALLLEQHLSALREVFPELRVSIVAHSMGGLIARSYVEGDHYGGEVDHLILVGTPNGGSKWTKLHLLLKAQTEFNEWRCDPDWHLSWIITSGLGEAARDLRPHSEFLDELNDRPRRKGVRYTVIAGTQSAAARVTAHFIESLATSIPLRASNWWLVGPARLKLQREAGKLLSRDGNSDGPVSVESAKLAGVKDVVLLHADHCSLFYPMDGAAPAAFSAIADRLSH